MDLLCSPGRQGEENMWLRDVLQTLGEDEDRAAALFNAVVLK